MFNQFVSLSYSQARYIFLKEIDTRGPIGKILCAETRSYMEVASFITNSIDRMGEWLDGGNFPAPMDLPSNYFNVIIGTARNLPSNILLYSNLDWNTFISAYLCVITKFTSLFRQVVEVCKSREQDAESLRCFEEHLQRVADVETSVKAIINLLDLGIGYSELIQVSNELVKEMRSWRESRPGSMRLSQAYLEALGFLKEDSQ